ncbi:MAG: VOC family protein [Cyanobacteria bacterium J06632_3]
MVNQAPANQPPDSAPRFTPRIAVDIGIVVADLVRSQAFYQDLLGLEVVADVRTSLIGAGRMVQLQHGASRLKLIELDASPPPQTSGEIAAANGYRYVTLLVADLAAVMAVMAAHRVTVVVPMTRLESGSDIAMVTDPDGNVVEFVQEKS